MKKYWRKAAGFLMAAVLAGQSGALAAAQEEQNEALAGALREDPRGAREELEEILKRQEELAGEGLLEETIGFDELFKAVKRRGLNLKAEFGLTEGMARILEIPEEIEGGSVSFLTQVDPKLRKWLFEAGTYLNGDAVLEFSLYGDQERLAFLLPQFFEGALAIGSGSLLEQYTGSGLEQILGEYPEGMPDLDLDFFPDMEAVVNSYDLTGEWKQAVEEGTERLAEGLSVEKQETEDWQIYKATCETREIIRVYRDIMNEYYSMMRKTGVFSMSDIWEMEDTVEESLNLAELVLEDELAVFYYVEEGLVSKLRFTLRVDGNQASAAVSDLEPEEDTGTDITADETEAAYDPDQDVTLDFDFVYRDPAKPQDGFDLTMRGTDGTGTEQVGMLLSMETETEETSFDTTVSIRLEELGQVVFDSDFFHCGYDAVTGDFDVDLTVEDEEETVSFVLDSTFTGVEKGKCFTWAIDRLALSSGTEQLGINGTITFSSVSGGIQAPEQVRMLLEMTQEELFNLAAEIQMKAESWARQFEDQAESEEYYIQGSETEGLL